MNDWISESNLELVSSTLRLNVNNVPALLRAMRPIDFSLSSIVYSYDRIHFSREVDGVLQRVTIRWKSDKMELAPALLNYALNRVQEPLPF